MAFEIDASPPATLEMIAAFEDRLGHPLPAPQRRLLTEIGNGGVVDWLAARDDGIGWSLLLGIDTAEPSRDLGRQLQTLRDRIHPAFFPFGRTVGGDAVCFSTRDSDRDSVWFWDHEADGSTWKSAPFSALVQVTDTLDEFLAQDYEPITAPVYLMRPTSRVGRLARAFFGR